ITQRRRVEDIAEAVVAVPLEKRPVFIKTLGHIPVRVVQVIAPFFPDLLADQLSVSAAVYRAHRSAARKLRSDLLPIPQMGHDARRAPADLLFAVPQAVGVVAVLRK